MDELVCDLMSLVCLINQFKVPRKKLNFYVKEGVDYIDPGCLEFLVKSRSRIKTLVFEYGTWMTDESAYCFQHDPQLSQLHLLLAMRAWLSYIPFWIFKKKH